MWVTIDDSFTRNLSIAENWNQWDYPWIFIVPLPFIRYFQPLLCKHKFFLFSYTDWILIVIKQTWTAESDVLHTILPNQPLSLQQNPKPTEYHETGCPSGLYTAFRDSSLSTIYNKLSFNQHKHNCCHSPRSQVFQDSTTHQQFYVKLSPLRCSNQRHIALHSVESYAGAIMINLFLSISHVWSWESDSDTIMLMSRVLQVRLVQF
jgi:hypothetical protein